ncbi:hypothetical protein ACN6MT_28890 [Neobacillus niacini]|uniref:hypothetical protein n=1 Tax=Neobacillus niacini TaxID=86668 RepID=UPI003B013705
MKFMRLIGTVVSIESLLFCSYILLFNPYTHTSAEPDVLTSYTIMYLLPMFLTGYGSFSVKPIWLIIGSIWALPISLYCLATPGVFKYLVMGPMLLVIIGIIMFKNKRTS